MAARLEFESQVRSPVEGSVDIGLLRQRYAGEAARRSIKNPLDLFAHDFLATLPNFPNREEAAVAFSDHLTSLPSDRHDVRTVASLAAEAVVSQMANAASVDRHTQQGLNKLFVRRTAELSSQHRAFIPRLTGQVLVETDEHAERKPNNGPRLYFSLNEFAARHFGPGARVRRRLGETGRLVKKYERMRREQAGRSVEEAAQNKAQPRIDRIRQQQEARLDQIRQQIERELRRIEENKAQEIIRLKRLREQAKQYLTPETQDRLRQLEEQIKQGPPKINLEESKLYLALYVAGCLPGYLLKYSADVLTFIGKYATIGAILSYKAIKYLRQSSRR